MLVDLMVAVWQKSVSIGSRGLQQFAHTPNVIGDLCFHRRSHAQTLVDAAEIIESEPERDGCPVVLPLLTKSVRQPCKSSRSHADAQILSLNNRGANSFRIRVAHNWD